MLIVCISLERKREREMYRDVNGCVTSQHKSTICLNINNESSRTLPSLCPSWSPHGVDQEPKSLWSTVMPSTARRGAKLSCGAAGFCYKLDEDLSCATENLKSLSYARSLASIAEAIGFCAPGALKGSFRGTQVSRPAGHLGAFAVFCCSQADLEAYVVRHGGRHVQCGPWCTWSF